MAYEVKGAPFRYRGAIDVSDCISSLEVMEKAGLDWTTAKCELYGKMPVDLNCSEDESIDKALELQKNGGHIYGKDAFRVCDNAYATYRTDYNIPLGVVKSKYTPVQNKEAFTFFDDAIGNNAAIWQTAGFFGNGERIFVSAKLPNNILVKGDPVENYLVFTNSHDGSSGVKILFTPLRVVCQNTLNAAIRGATNYVSFRHTVNVHAKIGIAQEILGITKVMTQEVGEYYNFLRDTKVSDDAAIKFIAEHNLTDEEKFKLAETGHTYKELVYRSFAAKTDANISTRKLNVISDMWDYYQSGIGQREISGTAWGVVNAVSGYYSNVDNSNGTARMNSLLYGDKNKKLEAAFNIAGTLNNVATSN